MSIVEKIQQSSRKVTQASPNLESVTERINELNPSQDRQSEINSSYNEKDPLSTHTEDIKEIREMLDRDEREKVISGANNGLVEHDNLDEALKGVDRTLLGKMIRPSYDPADEFSNEYGLFLDIGSQSEQEEVNGAVEKIVYGEVNGLEGEYKLIDNNPRSSRFWATYVDREEETLLQAPRKRNSFEDSLERVERVRENKEVLDQADEYLDQVLEVDENRTVGDNTIDYEWLQENEELVREEIEGGIETASEEYQSAIVEVKGQAVPVIVADYNDQLDNWVEDTDFQENEDRFRAVGKYIDALIEQGVYTAVPNDYFDEHYGVNDMYINEETGEVGVSDLGELASCVDDEYTRPSTPEVSVTG